MFFYYVDYHLHGPFYGFLLIQGDSRSTATVSSDHITTGSRGDMQLVSPGLAIYWE